MRSNECFRIVYSWQVRDGIESYFQETTLNNINNNFLEKVQRNSVGPLWERLVCIENIPLLKAASNTKEDCPP